VRHGPAAEPRSDLGSPNAPQGGSPIRFPHDGSVHLGLDLPIEGGWLGWGEAPGLGANDSAAKSSAAEFTAPEFSAPESSGLDPEDSDALQRERDDPAPSSGRCRGIRGCSWCLLWCVRYVPGPRPGGPVLYLCFEHTFELPPCQVNCGGNFRPESHAVSNKCLMNGRLAGNLSNIHTTVLSNGSDT
jgi:hypothetical protein